MFTIEKITMQASTESGKQLVLTSTDPRVVAYYKGFGSDSSRGTTLTLFKNSDGEWTLSRPGYSNTKKLRVVLQSVIIEEVADQFADDSFLDD